MTYRVKLESQSIELYTRSGQPAPRFSSSLGRLDPAIINYVISKHLYCCQLACSYITKPKGILKSEGPFTYIKCNNLFQFSNQVWVCFSQYLSFPESSLMYNIYIISRSSHFIYLKIILLVIHTYFVLLMLNTWKIHLMVDMKIFQSFEAQLPASMLLLNEMLGTPNFILEWLCSPSYVTINKLGSSKLLSTCFLAGHPLWLLHL